MKRLAVLGSTGTIGENTLALVDAFPDRFRVVALAAGRNVTRLREQIAKYRPRFVAVQEESAARELGAAFPGLEIGIGDEGNGLAAAESGADVVVVGIVGFAALAPTLRAVRAGKHIALANKETLVAGGELFRREIRASGATVIPVDSEHNALFQLLRGRDPREVSTLVLTASGGPLLKRPDLPLEEVTPAIAIAHPNWKMGPKISVDSATLMNKGLELIEASYLFDMPQERIEVWVHPQSIVHGALWLVDNSCLAQLSKPDMRSSIGYALDFPERLPAPIPKLDLQAMSRLDFFPPDLTRFPALRLAREALDAGPSHVVALNASNEIAVAAFLEGRMLFSRIAPFLEERLAAHRAAAIDSIETIFALDAEARTAAIAALAVRPA